MFDEGQFLTLIRDANNENYAWGTKKAARELLLKCFGFRRLPSFRNRRRRYRSLRQRPSRISLRLGCQTMEMS